MSATPDCSMPRHWAPKIKCFACRWHLALGSDPGASSARIGTLIPSRAKLPSPMFVCCLKILDVARDIRTALPQKLVVQRLTGLSWSSSRSFSSLSLPLNHGKLIRLPDTRFPHTVRPCGWQTPVQAICRISFMLRLSSMHGLLCAPAQGPY